jgi:hypothetical protein
MVPSLSLIADGVRAMDRRAGTVCTRIEALGIRPREDAGCREGRPDGRVPAHASLLGRPEDLEGAAAPGDPDLAEVDEAVDERDPGAGASHQFVPDPVAGRALAAKSTDRFVVTRFRGGSVA